jgi:two-component system heavy metal sensor histidine kinase CusS
MKRASALALSTRLLIAFTTAAFTTLSLAIWYIDHAAKRGIIEKQENILGDHLEALQLSIDNNDGSLHAAEMLLRHTIGADKNEKSFGSLTSADGRTLIQTPGFDDFSPPRSAFPRPATTGQSSIQLTEAHNAEGRPLILATALIRQLGSAEPLICYFTTDALAEEYFVTKFRLEVAFVLFAGTLMSAGFAWIISRRGLRPIGLITKEIEQTTARALQTPGATEEHALDTTKWPREITGLSDAFTALRSRLSRSFYQLQQFSDDAAHELRSPLNNLMGLTSLTLRQDRSPEEYRATLVSALEECDRLKKIADGLLFISRADHRRSALSPVTFDATEVITEVVNYHSQIAEDKNVTLRVSAKGQLTADRTLFRQALTNLLSNALRHTPSAGDIEVTFDVASDSGKLAELAVSDTGEGIAVEHLPHIFDRFYRVDVARTHQAGAPPQTGLGLDIVKAIVELHGGWAEGRKQTWAWNDAEAYVAAATPLQS